MKINLHVFIFVLIVLLIKKNKIKIINNLKNGLLINPFFAFLREKVLTNPLKYCKVY